MRLYKIKFIDKNASKYFVVKAKNTTEAKKLFKKAMPSFEIKTEARAATNKFIKNTEVLKSKNIRYNIVPIKKKFINSKGRFISTKNVENIRAFYSENFTEDDRKKINLYYEIIKMDKDIFDQTVKAGAGMIIDKKLMYIGEDATGQSSVQLTTDQRLSAAKKMKSKYRVIDEDGKEKIVRLNEFRDIIKSAISNSKNDWINNKKDNPKGGYYKTIVFMDFDSENNILSLKLDFNEDIISY